MSRGELKEHEHHPAAYEALRYVQSLGPEKLVMYMESMCSVNIESNSRKLDICIGTLDRVMKGLGVGERYILGLAWFLRDMEDKNEKITG
jgi:hypothetical protein